MFANTRHKMPFGGAENSRFALRLLAIIGVLAVVSISGAVHAQSGRQVARERVNAYLTANPQLDKETANAMQHHYLRKGMTMPQVEAAWGRPKLVKKFRSGAVVQWFFDCDWPHHCANLSSGTGRSDEEMYVSQALFENGRLVEWDD